MGWVRRSDMGPSFWLAQVNPIVVLAAAVFIIPVLYLIGSALRDRSWIQLGVGIGLLGVIVFLAFHRIVGGVLLIAGAILAVAAFLRARSDRQDFQLE